MEYSNQNQLPIVDVEVLKTVVQKLDSSIERLTEVNNNISKLLAVHERRLDSLEKNSDHIEEKLNRQYLKSEESSKELSFKIDSLVEKINIKLDENYKREVEQYTRLEKSFESQIEKKITPLATRIDVLERWKWWVIGAAFGAGLILSNFVPLTLPLVA